MQPWRTQKKIGRIDLIVEHFPFHLLQLDAEIAQEQAQLLAMIG